MTDPNYAVRFKHRDGDTKTLDVYISPMGVGMPDTREQLEELAGDGWIVIDSEPIGE